MKLAATTLGCPEWNFEETLKRFEAYGIEGVEIRGLEKIMEADKIRQFLPENARGTLEAVKAHGLKLIGFGTSCNFHDPEKYEASIQQGKTSIDVCQRMQIPFIRVFGDVFPAEIPRKETMGRIISGLKELCAYAQGKLVGVYLEIHGECNTVEAIAPILEAMKKEDAFGILWDLEHSDRAYGDDVEEFYELIRPFVRHVHVKDCIRANAEQPCRLCRIGKGEVPIPRLVSWLKRDGYQGYLSLEWEKMWVPELPEAEIAFPEYVKYMTPLL